MTAIKTVGIAGTGLIGAGWAARLLIRGFDVVAYDVQPAAEAKLRAAIDVAWPSMAKLLGPQGERASSLSPPISRRWPRKLTSSMKPRPSARTSRSSCSAISTLSPARR